MQLFYVFSSFPLGPFHLSVLSRNLCAQFLLTNYIHYIEFKYSLEPILIPIFDIKTISVDLSLKIILTVQLLFRRRKCAPSYKGNFTGSPTITDFSAAIPISTDLRPSTPLTKGSSPFIMLSTKFLTCSWILTISYISSPNFLF